MKLYSSAYNVWPADEDARLEFMTGLVERDWVGGLELGYVDSLSWPVGTPDDLPAIVTGVPGTTAHNATDPDFGLASPDEAGRQRALAWTKKEAADIARLNSEGHKIRAVQIHSAPTGKAVPERYVQSLVELAREDWGGAELWLEHCDAWVEGQTVCKGFLTVEEELDVLGRLAEQVPDVKWGMVINWARSAIEGRSADTAQAHVEAAAKAGWLRHVGFSSCSGEQTAFGPAWDDQHLPLAGTSVAPVGTLLGAGEIAKVLAAAGDGVTYGLKISLRPTDQDTSTKLAALDENAELIRETAAGR